MEHTPSVIGLAPARRIRDQKLLPLSLVHLGCLVILDPPSVPLGPMQRSRAHISYPAGTQGLPHCWHPNTHRETSVS